MGNLFIIIGLIIVGLYIIEYAYLTYKYNKFYESLHPGKQLINRQHSDESGDFSEVITINKVGETIAEVTWSNGMVTAYGIKNLFTEGWTIKE